MGKKQRREKEADTSKRRFTIYGYHMHEIGSNRDCLEPKAKSSSR
jgi:hypothetical protein